MIEIKDILEKLPHRYPLLLVDRVTQLDKGDTIYAYKNVTFNEPFFQGHFPGFPVMPGVLILEALAQTGVLLVLNSFDDVDKDDSIFLFTGIEKAKFRRQVVPGDKLELECKLIKRKMQLWKIQAVAKVDGAIAAEAELTATLIKK